MKRVATAVVLVPLVLLAVFKAPLWLFFCILGLVALLTLREYLQLADGHGTQPLKAITYAVVAIVFASATLSYHLLSVWQQFYPANPMGPDISSLPAYVPYLTAVNSAVRSALILSPLLFLVLTLRRSDPRTSLPAAAVATFGVCYVGGPLLMLGWLRSGSGGGFLVLYTLVVVWAGDIFAYYVGRHLGRRKLAPQISPGKTWEGAGASFLGAIVVGTLLWQHAGQVIDFLLRMKLLAQSQSMMAPGNYPPTHSWWVYAVVTALVNVAAQLGDLVESMIKRGAGAKDSGSLIPGHGGLLDRIDALLLAVPVVCYYALNSSLLPR